jgi:hypothetical protein
MQEILDRSHVLMQCFLINRNTKEKEEEDSFPNPEDQSKKLKELEEGIYKKKEELKRHINSIN